MPRNQAGAPMPSRGNEQNIAFGLVNIPVRIKPLKESKTKTSVSANYICPQHRIKVKSKKWCEEGKGHECDAVLAYPVGDDYVELDDDLVASIIAEKTGELRIERFVEVAEIDPIYFDDRYLVYPSDKGAATHDLLKQVLIEENVAAVGSAVLAGGKATKLVVVRWSPATETLVAHTCLYDSGIRWSDVDLVANAAKARPAPGAQEVAFAKQLVQALRGSFDPTAVADTYTQALRDLIDQAAQGKAPKAPAPAAATAAPLGDIIGDLRASVEAAKAKAAPKPKAAAKKKAVKA